MSISHATLQPLALRAGSTTVCASSSKARRRSTAHCNGRTIDQTRAKAGASSLLLASGRDRCIQKAAAHKIEQCNLWEDEESFYGQSRWYMCRKPPLRPAPESADKSQRPTWRSGREKGRVLCTPSGGTCHWTESFGVVHSPIVEHYSAWFRSMKADGLARLEAPPRIQTKSEWPSGQRSRPTATLGGQSPNNEGNQRGLYVDESG
jgi:hypothetical protein